MHSIVLARRVYEVLALSNMLSEQCGVCANGTIVIGTQRVEGTLLGWLIMRCATIILCSERSVNDRTM